MIEPSWLTVGLAFLAGFVAGGKFFMVAWVAYFREPQEQPHA